MDQEEDLELGDESGKLVFLNHINKQRKIPRSSKRKSIKKSFEKMMETKDKLRALSKKNLLKQSRRKNPEKKFTKKLENTRRKA